MLASGVGLIARRRNPGVEEFTRAWEARVGEMRFGQPGTYPPAGAYQAWREAHESEGISAGDWLDRVVQRMNAPRARGLVSGLFETVGRWEGAATAHPEGVLVTGEHIWFDAGRERREPDDTVVPWDLFKGATLTAGRLELKPETPPSMIFMVTVTEFDERGAKPWVQLLEQNGVSVERKDMPPEQAG
jgi:hypothetical protein